MKKIYLNLKRFDVPAELGGVNRISQIGKWAETIITDIQADLTAMNNQAEFTAFFPETHLLPALAARQPESSLIIGAQGVYRQDVEPGGNFGALTTSLPAAALFALGCGSVLIGHCEERRDLEGILAEAGLCDAGAVNRILNKEIRSATARSLQVLYCIGEKAEEQENWQNILRDQLVVGLEGVDRRFLTIAYEPVWSIGPGKKPADQSYIKMVAGFVKELTGGLPVVYGGGLKSDNAAMLASITEIDGGLIALTRFSGEIGFYPAEYLGIIKTYLEAFMEEVSS